MLFTGTARQPNNNAASILIPVRRSQSGKCRNEIDTAVIYGGQHLNVRRGLYDTQRISQPLYDRTAYEHATLKCVLSSPVDLPGDGR